MPTVENYTDSRFRGIDATSAPEILERGMVQSLLNMIVAGDIDGQGGYLTTRPGKQGKLSSALGQIIYAKRVFTKSDGSQYLIFAAGNGYIYSWLKNATTVTQITALGTFTAASVQFERLGDYLFIIGATDGKLRRIKNDLTTIETTLGLATPVYTLSSALSNSSLGTFASLGYDVATAVVQPWNGINQLKAAGSSSAFSSQGWNDTGAGPIEMYTNIDPNSTGDWYVRFDDPNGSILSNIAVTLANTNSTTHGTGDTRYPIHFQLDCRYKASFANDSIIAQFTVYSDTGATTALATQSATITGPVNSVVTRRVMASFAGLVPDTAVRSVRVQLLAGPDNRGGDNGPYLSYTVLSPYIATPTLTYAGSGTAATVSVAFPVPGTTAGGIDNSKVYSGSQRLTRTLSSVDWSGYQKIAIPITRAVDFTPGSIYLNLRKTTTGTVTNGNAATTNAAVLVSVDGKEYLSFDLSTLTPSQRTGLNYLDLIFGDDFVMPVGTENSGATLFTLGNILLAGNLSVGYADYVYRVTETSGSGASAVTSGASKTSNAITPTSVQAQSDTTISSAITGTTLNIYRAGGTFDDGQYRLLATVTAGSNYTDPAGKYQWTTATRVFHDNIPDSDILNAPVLLDHEPPPDNATALAAYNGRLTLAVPSNSSTGKGGGLWVSQLRTGAEVGLYWNGLNVPNVADAPDRATQGVYTPIRGEGVASVDIVRRLIAYESRLVIFYTNARYVFSGVDVDDFYLTRWQTDENKGCVAAEAVTVFFGKLVFLASDGLRAFDLSGADVKLSGKIAAFLNPSSVSFGAAPLSATGYAKSSLWTHANRLYLAAPTAASGTSIAVVYVFDGNTQEWVGQWQLGTVTGGVSFSGTADTDDLFVTDEAGQISALPPNTYGDKATSGASVTAVTCSVTTRGYAPPGDSRAWGLKGQLLSFDVTAPGVGGVKTTLTAAISAQADTTKQWITPYSPDAITYRQSVPDLSIDDHVRGTWLQVVMSYSATTAPVLLHSVKVQTAPIIGQYEV